MSGGTGGNDNSGNHHSTNSNAVNHPPHNSSSGNLALNQNPNTSNHATTNSISILATNSMVALRPHNFQPVSALRPVRCDYCGDKLWGLAERLFGNDLVAQAKSENKLVPSVVTKCIEAVEEQAITSTLKNYFRQLPNPLFTFELHEAFVTVALLMIHLSNIEKQCEHNKMNSQNLGVIFGPTLLRSPNPNRPILRHAITAKIVELTVLNRAQLFRKPYGTNTVPPTNTGLSSSTTTSSVANNNPHPSKL
ncbi:hypothetical protein H4Q26_000460 [Puccinia striiformis f. sp. tritici PST-130]|nr:hypothetical protein H4Q26_000460 [Puccinia striiformis f. sp. tritici PST-130]